jgi:hypothetical protein
VQTVADQRHRCLLATQPTTPPCSKPKKQLHEKAADELCYSIDEEVRSDHGLMVALSGYNEKTGKRGCGASAMFSRLFKTQLPMYVVRRTIIYLSDNVYLATGGRVYS